MSHDRPSRRKDGHLRHGACHIRIFMLCLTVCHEAAANHPSPPLAVQGVHNCHKVNTFLTLGKINRSLMKCYRKRLVDSVGSHQVKVNIAYHHIGVAVATINTCGIYDKQNLAYGEAAHLTV